MKKRKNLNKKDMTAPAEAAGTNTEIRIQKADMKARTSYDYRRLEQRHSLLIPCSVEEEKETLYIKINTEGMQPFETLRGESRLRKIEVLLQAAELFKEDESKYVSALEQAAELAQRRLKNPSLRAGALEKVLLAYPAAQSAPRVLYDLGYTYEQMGKNAQAEETYKRLIINYPTDKYASRAQSRLSRLEK